MASHSRVVGIDSSFGHDGGIATSTSMRPCQAMASAQPPGRSRLGEIGVQQRLRSG